MKKNPPIKNEYTHGEPSPHRKNPFKNSVLYTPEGQWAYPGQVTKIPGNTMATHGYGNIPLWTVPDVGNPRMVYPNTGTQYFEGASNFTEYPQSAYGGDPSLPAVSGWLDQMQAGGNWGTPEQMYNDSLNLYKAYQFQKANTTPDDFSVKMTGVKPGTARKADEYYKKSKDSHPFKDYPSYKKAKAEWNEFTKSKDWYEKSKTEPYKSKFAWTHGAPEFTNVKDLQKQDPEAGKIAAYYNSLPFNAPTRIGYYNSADLGHSQIKPVKSYYDGRAWSPVYKKPIYDLSKQAKEVLPISVNDPNDPRLKAYSDSLNLYKGTKSGMPGYVLIDKDKMTDGIHQGHIGVPFINSDTPWSTLFKKDKIKPIDMDTYDLPSSVGKAEGTDVTIPIYKKPVQPYIYKKPAEKLPQEVVEYLERKQMTFPINEKEPELKQTSSQDTTVGKRIAWRKDPATKKMVPVITGMNQKVSQGQRLYNKDIPTASSAIPEGFVPDYGNVTSFQEGGYIPVGYYPSYQNPDGSYSNEVSMGMNVDDQEILLPSFWDGQRHNDQETEARYKKTGEHLGKFDTVADSERAAKLREFMNNEVHPYSMQNGGWLDQLDEEYRRGGGVNPLMLSRSKRGKTSKNIQSSINKIFLRNHDIFGPGGKNIYDPKSKYQDGGGWLDNLT